MNRVIESRLQKLEQNQPGLHLTHEQWLDRMQGDPPWTEAESMRLDEEIEAEALAEFGSLAAAATAAREKANRTRDAFDAFLARDLEVRAEEGAAHALA